MGIWLQTMNYWWSMEPRQNKNTAGCYRTSTLFFVAVLCAHTHAHTHTVPRGKNFRIFCSSLSFRFFLPLSNLLLCARVCVYVCFFPLLARWKFHRVFKKIEDYRDKKARLISHDITGELCISTRRAIFSERLDVALYIQEKFLRINARILKNVNEAPRVSLCSLKFKIDFISPWLTLRLLQSLWHRCCYHLYEKFIVRKFITITKFALGK